ncbi:MAG: hypothetical protein ACOX9B_06235 [Candidatus Xenobium sp.]|jgi:hypothetical protein|nr:hypothetical protein [Burkholderiales bacterium]
MRHAPLFLTWIFLVLVSAGALALETDAIKDMRGDEGVLMDLRPTGAVYLAPNRILVTDSNNRQLHIFDLEGRRFRRLNLPRDMPSPSYSGIASLGEDAFLVCGDHFHEKNAVRFIHARSVLHRYVLQGEGWTRDSADTNFNPDATFRRTGHFGQTVKNPLKLEGIAVDSKQKRIFFGLSRPLGPDGSVLIYEARLDEVMARDRNLEFHDVKPQLIPEVETAVGQAFYLSDMCYVPGKGLLVLLASQSPDGRRFGSNQIWLLRGGFGPARLVGKEIAPGNRAAGLAVREEGKDTYEATLVCDNDPERTGMPSRLVTIRGLKL